MKSGLKNLCVLLLASFFMIGGLSGCGSSHGSGAGTTSGHLLAWKPPTTDADGSLLTDLAGFIVYYGTASKTYDNSVDVGTATSYSINIHAPGVTYYFAVKAYDVYGNLSEFSAEISAKL